jgi:CheY-like chemotaxis protein
MANILIVDDSQTQVANLLKILEPEGHAIAVAPVAKAVAEQPDLILMDVVMPGLNGFQATRKLSRDPATQHIPIILVSTKDRSHRTARPHRRTSRLRCNVADSRQRCSVPAGTGSSAEEG